MLPTTQKESSGSLCPRHRKNTFDVEEPNTKTKIWYHWLNIRFRQYMILEIFFVISLIMMLYRLQTLSNQNDRVLEMVNSMHSQFGKMERKIELLFSQKPNQDVSHQFGNIEPLEQSIANVLKTMKVPKQDSTGGVKPIVSETKKSTTNMKENTLNTSLSEETYRFNAADYLRGASVDNDYSSSSSLNPIIGYDQTNLVLLDRSHPPADKAWCSNAENPVLTVNLAKYIKPISVSYQHSKWKGTIPNGTPRIQYDSNEQLCNISSHLDIPLIGKVQFRFRENYGNTKTTCVNLVRVYGETKTPAKIEQKSLENEKICTDLRWYYHNSYFKYTWEYKNCTVLYENNCCSDCPECCQECMISDYNKFTFGNIGGVILAVLIVALLVLCLTFAIIEDLKEFD
ncbi:unnamed protein product [Caenorhabditis nigoni]